MSNPVDNPSIDQRLGEATEAAETARGTYRALNTIDPIPSVPVADNSDPALATNWVTVFQHTTDTLSAGQYTGMIQAVWNIDQSNREGFFETFIDGVSLGILKIPIVDSQAQSPNPLFFLPDYFSDFTVDKAHTIETKALINQGGGNPSMTIDSIFALLSQTG